MLPKLKWFRNILATFFVLCVVWFCVTLYIVLYDPPQDFIVLRNDSGVKLNQAQLIDSNGRTIRTVALEGVNQQIGLEDLAAGTYFLQVFSADASVTKRFIKQ